MACAEPSCHLPGVPVPAGHPKVQQENQECEFIQCLPQSPAGRSGMPDQFILHLFSCGTVNCSGTSDRAGHTQPREGQGIIGAGKRTLEVILPSQGHSKVLPSTFSMVLVPGLSAPHRAVPAQPEHPARWLNCKKHKI